MHVLICDPLHGGHHLNWVRLVADACAPYARRITFATAAGVAAAPAFAEHLKGTPAHFEVDDSMPTLDLKGKLFEQVSVSRRVWSGLVAAVRKHRPDRVYLPYADIFTLVAMAHIPGTWRLPISPAKIDAIVLSSPFAYGRDLPFRQRMRAYAAFVGLKKLPFGRLLFIDPIAHNWLCDNHPSVARRSELLPDPVTPVNKHEKSAARAELGLPTDGRWISSVGVLDRRKGVADLIAAFAEAPLGPTDRLLLAGTARPDVLSAIAKARARLGEGRIFLLDQFLSDRGLELAVSAADLVAVTHRFPEHIGSASVLIRATAAGRPVIASQRGWPGYVTKKHSLGWIFPENPADRPAAIANSLAAAQTFALPPQARAFADFHSVAGFGQILTAPLRSEKESQAASSVENGKQFGSEASESERVSGVFAASHSRDVACESF